VVEEPSEVRRRMDRETLSEVRQHMVRCCLSDHEGDQIVGRCCLTGFEVSPAREGSFDEVLGS
jgi:hypothetical protein